MAKSKAKVVHSVIATEIVADMLAHEPVDVPAVELAPAAPVSTGMSELLAAIGGNVAAPIPSAHKSAKQFIREVLSVDGASYTVDQLCALGGHTPVTVRTMLSDLRSPKYAGKAGVFITVSQKRTDGQTYYSKPAPAPAAPAA